MKPEYLKICEFADLIFRHILHQTSENEENKLEEWRASSIHNNNLYRRFVSETFLSEKVRFMQEHSVENAYEEFIQRVELEIRKKRRLLFYRYAATIAIFLCIGLSLFLSNPTPEVRIPVVSGIAPGSIKAILTLADGEQVHIYDTTYSLYTVNEASGVLPDTQTYRSITIPRGGEYFFSLSDGTRVWLNSESEIHFPVQFSNTHREITMSGEIFFKVARDSTAPFIIHTGKGYIKVLGTSFNVRNYVDEPFLETTLVDGKVAFLTDKQTFLTPGEQLRMNNETGEVTVRSINPHLVSAWKDGRFVFDKQPLSEIMTTIARWYDVDVVFENEALKGLRFSGNIKRYGELEPLLDMLRLINKVNITVSGNKVVIH